MSDNEPLHDGDSEGRRRPPILTQRGADRRLLRMIAIAAGLHLLAIAALWSADRMGLTTPEKEEVYEVELIDAFPEGELPEGLPELAPPEPPPPLPEDPAPASGASGELDDAPVVETEDANDDAALALIYTPTPAPATPTPTPTATPSPRPTATASARPTPTATATPTPTDEPTPKPTKKATPKPTKKPTPKPTPKPVEKAPPEPTKKPAPVATAKPAATSKPKATEPAVKATAGTDGRADDAGRRPVGSRGAEAGESPRPDGREGKIQDAVDRVREQTRGSVGSPRPGREGGGGNAIGTGPGDDTAPIGVPGGTGTGEGVRGAEFLAYYGHMIERIRERWVWAGTRKDLEVKVHFRIDPSGFVRDLKLSQSSGDVSYDLSVIRAVRTVGRLGMPPEQFRKDFADVELTFHPGDLRGEGPPR